MVDDSIHQSYSFVSPSIGFWTASLTTSSYLSSLVHFRSVFVVFQQKKRLQSLWTKFSMTYMEVLPRFKIWSPESKSRVLIITPLHPILTAPCFYILGMVEGRKLLVCPGVPSDSVRKSVGRERSSSRGSCWHVSRQKHAGRDCDEISFGLKK